MSVNRFHNRRQAGALLGEALRSRSIEDPLVLGLLRGGVPVAHEVAKALRAAWDLLLVRKLGVPGQRELAFGAIADGGVQVLNEQVVRRAALSRARIEREKRIQQEELLRRARYFRGDRPPAPVRGRNVVLVDDGLATGATMRAAIKSLANRGARAILPAVPVAPPRTLASLREEYPDASCQGRADRRGEGRQAPAPPSSRIEPPLALLTPSPFWGVGAWYDDFGQVSDAELSEYLSARPAQPDPSWPVCEQDGGQAGSTPPGSVR